LAITLPQSVEELKSSLQCLDSTLRKMLLEWARQCYQSALEWVDDVLAEHRAPSLGIEHRRAVWYQTCLGSVSVKRRVYRGAEGRRRCLLDELMGTSKRDHFTPTVKKLTLEVAASMPYRRAADILRKLSAIDLPHQTIWRRVARAADPYLKKMEQELKWFTDTGEIPDGEGRQVARLMVEADGVMVSLQREKEKRAEVKLGIAYEGWEEVSRNRYRTVNKTAFASMGGADDFWAGMTLKLQGRYDWSALKDTIVGGDGACWVRDGADYLNGSFQLDRYHLNRELTTALGKDKETKGKVWQAIERGDVPAALQILVGAMKQARGEQAERLRHAWGYLQANLSGLKDYRLGLGKEGAMLRRTGAIEGNVDKLVARRMKNQGMSWSLEGIRRLLCVRFLVLEDKLGDWLRQASPPQTGTKVPLKKVRRIVNRVLAEDPTAWLQARLPALHGTHASRPWVDVLRSLTEAPTI